MNVKLFYAILMTYALCLTACHKKVNKPWQEWQTFKQIYISKEGRVIDSSTKEKITSSEGQSYAMFFALLANDRAMFDKLLQWTEKNLAAGNLGKNLPAWKWGRNAQNKWSVLDSNNATDSDLWLAYDLLEAGRLWHSPKYDTLGKKLLKRVSKEIIDIPGLGMMLLPGKIGFKNESTWKLNPSYFPPQLMKKFAQESPNWKALKKNTDRLLLESSPKGYAPDWIVWKTDKGWIADPSAPDIGSYNAIRVYLWVGMLDHSNQSDQVFIKHFQPMVDLTQQRGLPPEQINVITGKVNGNGPVGFSAALLPLMKGQAALAIQKERVAQSGISTDNYYNSVLILFGQGWEEKRYRFNDKGELLTPWQ